MLSSCMFQLYSNHMYIVNATYIRAPLLRLFSLSIFVGFSTPVTTTAIVAPTPIKVATSLVSTKLHPDAGAHHPPGNTYTPRHHLLGMIVAVLKLQLLNLNARHLLALKQQ